MLDRANLAGSRYHRHLSEVSQVAKVVNDKQVNMQGHWDRTPKINGGEETWKRGFSMQMKVTPLYGVTQHAMVQLMCNRGVSTMCNRQENRAQT